ncbi:MAG: hypothetical protein KF870_16300 [Leadbetterella sp.]|nr:hypothetical protein [Leadbetterella sp.]
MIKAFLLLIIPLAQVIFRPEASMQTFENQYAYYVDSTNALSVEALLAAPRHFTVIPTPSAHFGRNLNTHWLRLPVRNTQNKAIKLYLQNSHPYIDNLEFYQVRNGRVVKEAAFDYEKKRKVNLVREVARPTFQVDLEAGEEAVVYAKFRNAAGTLIFDVRLFGEESFLRSTLHEERIYNVLMGTLLAFSVLAFCYFIISKSAIYLYYGLYTLFINIAIQGQTGRLYNMLDFKIDFFNGDSSFRYYGSLALIANILFLKELFGEKPWKGIYKYMSLTFLSLGIFLNVVTFFDWGFIYYKVNSLVNVYTLFSGVFLLNLLYFINKKKKAYVLYLVSFLPLIILLAYRLVTLAGVMHTPVNFSHFTPPALALESLILLVGLSKSFIRQLLEKNRLEKHLKVAHIETQEAERQKIAADLHDDLGSTLALLKDKIASGSDASLDIVNKALKDLRSISHQLMPQEFEHLGFRKSLEKYILEHNESAELQISLIFYGENTGLPPEKELNIYRILTELIHNTKKHSTAKEVCIQMTRRDDCFSVSYEESGGGAPDAPDAGGLGQRSVESRLRYIDARILENKFGKNGYLLVFETKPGE